MAEQDPRNTHEQLYGPRPSVQARWPGLGMGEIWEQIDSRYPKTIKRRPWFLPSGAEAIMGSIHNPRNVRSAQRTLN